jgi:branched-subunit amino acid aminotransferase/4-amino-4-deoxychorismate lyase
MKLPVAEGVRMPDRAIWIDGRLCRGAAAAVSLFDRGARDGEGLFETLRVYGGRAFEWQRHLERLVLSAAELGFPVPPSPATLERGLSELLAEERLTDAVARLTVTRGIPGGRPTRTGCWIEVEPLAARMWPGTTRGGATAIVSKTRFEPGPLGPHKTTSRLAYHLAREEARSAHADEAILVSSAGLVLEGAVSNLFARLGDDLLTPPLALGLLPGITRSIVMALGRAQGFEVREAPFTVAQLENAREVFLTNSVQEVVPLIRVGGRAVPETTLGARLREVYRERVAAMLGTPG